MYRQGYVNTQNGVRVLHFCLCQTEINRARKLPRKFILRIIFFESKI
jgi:hypothetical protein